MKFSVQLYKRLIIVIFLLLEIFFPLLHAQTVLPQTVLPKQQNRFIELLKLYGIETKKGDEFYNAGVNCHQHLLKTIVFINMKELYFFFSNDSLGNCTLSMLNFTQQLPQNTSAAYSCAISNTVARQLFTPWFLDAIRAGDQTQKMNPPLQKFFEQLRLCFKPIKVDEMLDKLESSTQVSKPVEKINVH
jgi:hypothetical protein